MLVQPLAVVELRLGLLSFYTDGALAPSNTLEKIVVVEMFNGVNKSLPDV